MLDDLLEALDDIGLMSTRFRQKLIKQSSKMDNKRSSELQ